MSSCMKDLIEKADRTGISLIQTISKTASRHKYGVQLEDIKIVIYDCQLS